jgi:hypothetical protein
MLLHEPLGRAIGRCRVVSSGNIGDDSGACAGSNPTTEGMAKMWVEPRIGLAENHGLSAATLNRALREIRNHEEQIREAWHDFFGA